MPGGAGTPGGYDGGSGSSSGGGGGGGGGGGEGGAAQRAAAQRAQAQLDADRLNAQRAAAAAVAEAEARETARENAIQLAALTPKTIPETRHHSADTPLQVLEQVTLDKDRDWEFQDTKAKAPITFKPEIEKYITRSPFTNEPIINERVKKYSPTYYQDRSKIDGKTWGERAEEGIKRGSGILGTMGKIALTGLTAGAGAGLFGKDIATVAKLANYKKRYDALQKSSLGKKLNLKELDFSNLRSNLNTVDGKYIAGDHHPNTKKRTFDEPRNGDGPKTTAEKITTGKGLEEGQKMLGLNDAQQNYIRKIIAGKDRQELMMISGKAKIRIDSGEASQIEKDVFQMIQEYLV